MLKTKHQQLFDILKEEFLRGEWPCGEKLPRLTVLAEKYSVSINIASKAVELLKNAGMVEAKVGDGIYSTFHIQDAKRFHYAGDRLYGHYYGAKPLRILLEDSAAQQVAFWNRFFQKFSSENPDIEIDANYQTWDERKEEKPFEAVIGGYPFLQKMIRPGDRGLADEWVKGFVPDLYDNCILDREKFPVGLPYGFSAQEMLAAEGTPEPEPGENILDYLERLPESMPGYLMRSSRLLLACMGVDMSKIGTDAFSPEDARTMLEVFERARKLYASGRLLWPHGKITDPDQMVALLKNHRLQAMGIQSNTGWGLADAPQIRRLAYPHGKKPSITVHFVHISENTLYPEEYLRLVKALLSCEVQTRAEKERIFFSIRGDVSGIESDPLRHAIRAGTVQTPNINTALQSDAFYNFLGWEFFYYLEGRRGFEVADLIHRKIRYYYLFTDSPAGR